MPSDKVLFDGEVFWVMNIKKDPNLRDTFATLGVADERRQSLIPSSLQVPVSSLLLLSCNSTKDLLKVTWPHQQVHQQQGVQSANKQAWWRDLWKPLGSGQNWPSAAQIQKPFRGAHPVTQKDEEEEEAQEHS